MVRLSRYSLIAAAVVLLAVYVPKVVTMAFGEREPKTHLFYSPVSEKFVWREKLRHPEGNGKEALHHAQFVRMDQDGKRFTREEFEQLLPFIYYKNMDIWGLLPLHLKGQVFGKQTIRRERQVMELTPRQVPGNAPGEMIWPLLESVPGRARLVFPEDRFRINARMEFINADDNRVDEALSRRFTTALSEAGFTFPAKLVAGRPTILKPFDAGVFLVDAEGAVFHLRRVEGVPHVVRTPIAPELGVRAIKVSENARREYLGLVLTRDDRLWLLGYDDYSMIPLPLEGYEPERMDFKLLVNPLYRTAVYSDETTIQAVVMDREHQVVARYQHTMSRAEPTLANTLLQSATPFGIAFDTLEDGFLRFSPDWHWQAGLSGTGVALALFMLSLLVRRRPFCSAIWDAVVILGTGFYGLVAVLLIPDESC